MNITLRLTVLVLALSMIPAVAIDIYLPAMPAISSDFSASADAVQNSLTMYFLGFCIGMLVFGPLSDVLGHKNLMLAGLLVFVGASVLCVLASEINAFLFYRFLQAIGGGAVFVISRALVGRLWPEAEVARMMSLVMGVGWIGPILAPAMGAEILFFGTWETIFIFLAVLALILFVLSKTMIPHDVVIDSKFSWDKVARESINAYKNILRDSKSMCLILCSSCIAAAYFAYLSGSAFIFTEYYGFSIRGYSLLFAFMSLGMVASSFLNRALLRTMPEMLIIKVCMLVLILCSVLLLLVNLADLGLYIFGGLLLTCLSLHIPIQANCAALLIARSDQNVGSAIAFLLSFTFGLGAVSSLLVSWLTATSGNIQPINVSSVMMAATLLGMIFLLMFMQKNSS